VCLDLPRYNWIQLVGFLVGPLTPLGELVRRNVQSSVHDGLAHAGYQAPQVLGFRQQTTAFDQRDDPIGVGLPQAFLATPLRFDPLAFRLLLEFAQVHPIGSFTLDDQAGHNVGDLYFQLPRGIVLPGR